MKVTTKVIIGFVLIAIATGLILLVLFWPFKSKEQSSSMSETNNQKEVVTLPQPQKDGSVSVEKAIAGRRSVRDYTGEAISLADVSQLLWSAQGITGGKGERAAPSAGALYPLEIYLVVGNVNDLPAGIYKYNPQDHTIIKVIDQDKRKELAEAALNQECVANGVADIVITGVNERTTQKYGERGVQYVHMEAGHAAQNVYLQSESLNLGTVTIGGFDVEKVSQVLGLVKNETPLYIMPVGKK